MTPNRRGLLRAVARAWPWMLLATVATLYGFARIKGLFAYGIAAGKNLADFLLEMATILPPVFLLVGLFDVWIPREVVERYAGRRSGLKAVPWMILLAMLQAGPIYVAFPFAVSLWRKGCAPRNVFIYLGAFSALKIPMLTFEVTFLGWRFSLARTAVTIPVFILLAVLMERLLPAQYEPPRLEEPSAR